MSPAPGGQAEGAVPGLPEVLRAKAEHKKHKDYHPSVNL